MHDTSTRLAMTFIIIIIVIIIVFFFGKEILCIEISNDYIVIIIVN